MVNHVMKFLPILVDLQDVSPFTNQFLVLRHYRSKNGWISLALQHVMELALRHCLKMLGYTWKKSKDYSDSQSSVSVSVLIVKRQLSEIENRRGQVGVRRGRFHGIQIKGTQSQRRFW